MTTIQQFFKYGLDRQIPALLDPPGEGEFLQLNLGPGQKKIVRSLPTGLRPTVGLGLETNLLTQQVWNAGERLPFNNNSIGAVHAYQFMEHLDHHTALAVLREVERVLVPGGVMFMVTPYPGHGHFYQALDHKTAWTEETWDWLFGNEYYTDHEQKPWELEVHTCFLMGIVYRNLDLFTQLVKP